MGITPFELPSINSSQHHAFHRTYFQDAQLNEVVPEYDFIVVGGGASGCVLASRLSEIDGVSVLLVEQGTTYVSPTYIYIRYLPLTPTS